MQSFFSKNVFRSLIILLIFFNIPLQAKNIPTVFVSILPQKYFLQQIVKDRMDIRVMVQPGASPATYEPSPLQMTHLSKAKIYFSIGVPFESKWLPKISQLYPALKMIQTDRGIEKIPIHHHHHDHGEMAPPSIPDPHIWLSPPLVKIQARHIWNSLQEIDPDNRQFYEQQYQLFLGRLNKLDDELRNTFFKYQHNAFMVFHPSWGYFAKAYGLRQMAIEIEGKDVKPRQLKQLIQKARDNHVRIIFAQPQFSSKSAHLIAREISGQVVLIDPLALDWEENLRNVAIQIRSASKNLK
ncbi:MAG: zinc ABC transporter substrate-binding protein [Candidatus Magnetomorum sp.]|nr:zinc ABC transporter substrate-binding protein [Candidatus Magnetomorum sp.]